jgi:hemerythrin
MDMIEWDKQYELGIKVIDDQHKELIKITGRLSDLLRRSVDGGDIYDEMVEVIDSLREYTVYHFDFEEDIFERLNYSLKGDHIDEHNKLIADLDSLDLRAVDEDQVSYGKKILKFLISWVFKHISGTDMLYRELFLANGIHE